MQNKRKVTVRSKMWLEVDGETVFGEGKRQLLEAIDRLGSISRAASQVGISYRRAWSYLRAMESRLGVRLIEAQRGGEEGGGARLTEEARVLIREYGELLSSLDRMVGWRSKDFF